MDKEKFLDTVHEIITSRGEGYGPPAENLKRIAIGWGVIFQRPVTPRQVVQAMIWTKLARDVESADPDNMFDIAGYAAISAELYD